jgi:hypothetical protein
MEGLAVAIERLTAFVDSVKATVDTSQGILQELVAWKPKVDGVMLEMRFNINTLRQQLGWVALNPILSVDPKALQPRPATAPASSGNGVGYGHIDRGPDGHALFHLHGGCRWEGICPL